MNSELYCEQFGRMHTVLKEKYLKIVNKNRVLFQQDNAWPLKGIENVSRQWQRTIDHNVI